MIRATSRLTRLQWLPITLLSLSGCVQQMADQPRIDAWEPMPNTLQNHERRMPVEGTVARGQLQTDDHLSRGRHKGMLVETFPFEIDAETLARGRRRFSIFCTPCHGATGNGRGSVVIRGFPQPPNFHSDRLRNAPAGHFFDVITNGIGRMPRFSDRIPLEDRWAIAAYIRALQLSQHAKLDKFPSAAEQRIRAELR